ncbi:BH3-interacting domain death agonist [Tupaia chinensis]|uniref:BH3-interacting domain death agonist n=1 Tax=Tupaia chinensis TaxID=246437 RepID=UPI0003C91EE7|nr:BH3-interacting domain death agonist [Tupaia chinensis]XP_006158409.1 BH3-interacting domain death agonist [Tupaia chinensis]XP_006158411.1 BH3-interacting domain death agonist [Tupaia chinensis]
MDAEVRNGSSLRDEHITNLLVFGFLQNCSHSKFQHELEGLACELSVRTYLPEDDSELQTDGNRASYRSLGRIEADSDSREDVAIQNIARHLAQIGDRMERSIHPRLVDQLAARFLDPRLSQEDRRQSLASALQQAMLTCPRDLETEKAMLVLTMLLAKKVADHTPALLRGAFHTAVSFISQNLLAYVRSLARHDTD